MAEHSSHGESSTHTDNVKEAPVHDALPRPGPKLKREALKDARMNDHQGEKPRGTSAGRLSRPARPGQMQGGPKKGGKRRASTQHRPQQATGVEKSSTDPEPLVFESPGGGRVQRCEGLRPPLGQKALLQASAEAAVQAPAAGDWP